MIHCLDFEKALAQVSQTTGPEDVGICSECLKTIAEFLEDAQREVPLDEDGTMADTGVLITTVFTVGVWCGRMDGTEDKWPV